MKFSLSLLTLAFCALQLAQAVAVDDAATITFAFPNGVLRESEVPPHASIERTYHGSIVDVDPTATTFAMECSHDGTSIVDFCVQMATITVIAGLRTFAVDAVAGGIYEKTDCRINATSAVCEVGGTFSGETLAVTLSQRISSVPVTITGGIDKLSASGSRTTRLSTIPTKTSTDDDDNYVTLTGTVTRTPTPTAPETHSAEPTSTGAAARITGAAWAVGMAAVALAV